ncbi:MAG: DUF4386 family protein [Paracoccaceae bacterium]
MQNLTKIGGYAALGCGLTYVVGLALYLTVLAPLGSGDYHAKIAFAADNHTVLTIWNLTIYVLNAILLAVLVVALWDRFRPASPALAQVTLTFGTIWATQVLAAGMVANVGLKEALSVFSSDPERAANLYQIFLTVENGLGGGNEIAGGVWLLTLSIAGFMTKRVSKGLSILGAVSGVSGLASGIPALSDSLGLIFGLGSIVWFFWAGVALLRMGKEQA